MTTIALEGLTKRFGRTVAVDDVSLNVPSGELFFILGPSGCGQTTLLRLIAGFAAPDSGRIHFGDRDVTHLSPNKRNTGMVFQSYALWPHMTVLDNVAYGLRVRRIRSPQRRERALATLRSVHMEDLADRKPNELSGGQQQRVALARALVVEPQVLLLDEPLSKLDAALRQEMRLEIKRLCAETRITTVYVTHDQKEALTMADTVAILRDARIVQVGAPRTLYARPGCRFVAAFLGESNFLSATVTGIRNGLVTLDTPAGRIESAPQDPSKSPRTGATVTCSIRPESVRILQGPARPPAPDDHNTIHGRLIQTIYLGEMAQHHFELSGGSLFKVLQLSPGDLRQPGDTVSLSITPGDIVLLTA
ncbi:MAG: ABC transporter ATP-binding protein [Planctomycetota bacterium]|jgi:iron(III) transport system ATP-binding protein